MNDFLNTILPLCSVKGDHRPLWAAVYQAHRQSGFNNPSLSKLQVNLVGQSSGNFASSVVAGLMTLGKKHGPIATARDDLHFYTSDNVAEYLKMRMKVAGFGNSFHKDGPDPAWAEVDKILRESYPATIALLDDIQKGLHAAGKEIYPNPGGYSAAACEATGFPHGLEEAIFIMPRMQVWLVEYIKTLE